jgi:hypothetical protein
VAHKAVLHKKKQYFANISFYATASIPYDPANNNDCIFPYVVFPYPVNAVSSA